MNREFLNTSPDVAARALLGCRVTGRGVTVRLTEVEAYAGVGEDPASHAFRGRTPRNAVMFGEPGVAYAYFVFGAHWCLNIVCGAPGTAAAVLLRAGAVIDGAGTARSRRAGAADRDLARGPARLAVALGVGAEANGTSVLDGTGPLLLTPRPGTVGEVGDAGACVIVAGPRVGVAGGAEVPWRFWIAGDPTVSPYRRHVPRRRGDGGAAKPDASAPAR